MLLALIKTHKINIFFTSQIFPFSQYIPIIYDYQDDSFTTPNKNDTFDTKQ